MLDTLRNLNDHDALILLSSTAQSLLPDPGVGSRVTDVLNAPEKSREQLLQELRHKLKLKEDDESPRAQAEIFNKLSSEISKYALKNSDIRQIKARLGARGDLNPGSYEIDISPGMRGNLAARGIRPKHIEDAVYMADAVHHLNSEGHDLLVSLFLKRVPSERGAFGVFVVAQRDGYTLRVRDALRIYHADVNMEFLTEPLAALRAFLNRYGVSIQIGPRSGILLLNEVFPFVGTWEQLDNAIVVDGKAFREFQKDPRWRSESTSLSLAFNHEYGILGIANQNAFNAVEIAIAYAFNLRQYEDDLRRHGVPVPRP